MLEGVALILKKGMEKKLVEWKPINSRLLKAKFKGHHNNLTVIQCYAPTNEAKINSKVVVTTLKSSFQKPAVNWLPFYQFLFHSFL